MKNTCKKAAKIQVSDEATRLALAGSQGGRETVGSPVTQRPTHRPFRDDPWPKRAGVLLNREIMDGLEPRATTK